ncbi:ThiF family adenylyltransferase [Nitrospirillum sp. BR 11163]|uniref:HesA/MoeB/ThiF family protein n=1 Tax=Nitrospirillum sp. BR 11163 TaxID=3104323 RepID=UPI002AFF7705|nr:ThiF family adenylyltransferase [Nitrospirillum sp. BR 11163]MEA1672649.1 ThiF family adenylyltransferase [Nitrospirillum sp. BR 11163]
MVERLSPNGKPYRATPTGLLRLASPEKEALFATAFTGQPDREGGCFARFGWRVTGTHLAITLAVIDPPQPGDIEGGGAEIKITANALRRAALATEGHPLAVGFIHAHPAGVAPKPSALDDEMDRYMAGYFADLVPGRPFVSLIVSRIGGDTAISGRIFHEGAWHAVGRVAAERDPTVIAWPHGEPPPEPPIPPERVARLTSAFGREAYQRLQRSTVALIGAGGTGSAAIPILARAGVGRLIIIDSDHASESNLERLHGSTPADVANRVPKVTIAKRSVAEYAPGTVVEAINGRLPQPEVLDAVLQADVLMGCTDQHSSRMAVADIATRYLIPAVDCGGLIEGRDGIVTGQLVQIVRFLAADPCPRCRGMISATRVMQEMLPVVERLAPADQAALAAARGERPDPILTAVPQIDTVGYITTTAGTLAAGFVIGWLTGRFSPAFERLQLDLVSDCLGAVDRPQRPRPGCSCTTTRGYADQAADAAPFQPPAHWPAPVRL